MLTLIAGILIWAAAHLFRRLAPEQRAALTGAMGENGSKGVMAGFLGLAILLMIFGYRGADFVSVYSPPAWTTHLNNLLMLIAIFLFGAGNSKGRARSLMRHPMLAGVIVWAVAHLLVNGDLASIVLFGGMIVWSLAEMRVINTAEPVWVRPEPGPLKGDIRLGIITLVIYAVIVVIHTWVLGYPTFPT